MSITRCVVCGCPLDWNNNEDQEIFNTPWCSACLYMTAEEVEAWEASIELEDFEVVPIETMKPEVLKIVIKS